MEWLKAKWAALPTKKRIVLGLVIAVLALIAVSEARAQSNCAGAADMFAYLSEQYGESPVTLGLINGNSVQTWANVETGTWTVIVVQPGGMACPIASGNDFEYFAPPPNA